MTLKSTPFSIDMHYPSQTQLRSTLPSKKRVTISLGDVETSTPKHLYAFSEL
ncbi:TPA: hypothetical protein ACVO0G_004526 [Vibrio diabolicus]